jgi:hypothetical protein
VIERPRVFQTAGDVAYTVIIAAMLLFWAAESIRPFGWLAGDRGLSVFCLLCNVVGPGFWVAMLINRRRSWTQRSPMMRYTVAELNTLDPQALAELGEQDKAFHARWIARRARRQRWNILRLINQR